MTTFDLATAGLFLVPALVWTIITRQLWAYRQRVRPKSQLFRLAPLVTAPVALHAFMHVVRPFVPIELRQGPTPAHLLAEFSMIASLAVGRHCLRLMPLPEVPPGRRWLAVNYGVAGTVAAVFAVPFVLPGLDDAQRRLAWQLAHLGLLLLFALFAAQAMRIARPATWGPDPGAEMTRIDLRIIGWGLAAAAVAFVVPSAPGEAWERRKRCNRDLGNLSTEPSGYPAPPGKGWPPAGTECCVVAE